MRLVFSWKARVQRVAVVRRLGAVDGSLPLGYIGVMALEAVIEEVLKLSAEERTELVARLLDSLDDKADPGHEAAWTEVIDRRMKDIAEERVDLVDAVDAMAQARAVTAARR
jgi:putative addiction module component (TIGR02574 family)